MNDFALQEITLTRRRDSFHVVLTVMDHMDLMDRPVMPNVPKDYLVVITIVYSL